MNEPINQIVGIINTTIHQIFQNRVPERSLTDQQVENKKTSHKYIIENKLIVYEKYDRHGNLITRIPWAPQAFDEKA